MSRYLLSILIAISSILILSCGGINTNPTSPQFQNPNQPSTQGRGSQAPTQDLSDLFGQMSAGQAAVGETVLAGTFEVLWPQGVQNLEQGQLMLAAQYFKSAFAQNQQSADAAIAYAIVDVMRDHRRFAVFLHPGVDKLFMNTPLIGHSEIFPNPFLAEDSYFLRLAALGRRCAKLVPSVTYPTICPVDSEAMFNPESFQKLKAMKEGNKGEEERPPSVVGPEGAGYIPGGQPVGQGGPRGDANNGKAGDRPTFGRGGRKEGLPREAQNAEERSANQSSRIQDASGAGMGSGTFMPTSGNQTGGTGPLAPAGRAPSEITPSLPLTEREKPISESEWAAIIEEYREAASRDGADIFISAIFYNNLKQFHSEIKEHIKNLELVRSVAEADGYSLALGMNVLDGTQKITFSFDKSDYHLLIHYYKMVDVLLQYIMAYDSSVTFVIPTEQIIDANNDMKLSPDEYLPPLPFGVLKEDPSSDIGQILPVFVQVLNGLRDTMKPLLDAGRNVQAGDPEPKKIFYLSHFHSNYVKIQEWTDLLGDIANNSTSGTSIKVKSGMNVIDVVAVYDALFKTPVRDIRSVLPTFDFVTREVVLNEEKAWNLDPSFGGFFPEKLEDANTYVETGKLNCVVYDQQMAKAKGYKLVVGVSSKEINEKGKVSIDNVSVNELVGLVYEVKDGQDAQVGKGVVKTLYEVIPLFDMKVLSSLFALGSGGINSMMMQSEGIVSTVPGGGTTMNGLPSNTPPMTPLPPNATGPSTN